MVGRMIDAFILPVLGQLAHAVSGVLPIVAVLSVAFTVLHWVAEPCNPGLPWYRKPGLFTDFVFMFVLPIVGGWMRLVLLVGGAMAVYGLWEPAEIEGFVAGGHGPLAGLPFWIQAVAYVIGTDLIMYWTHRTFHGASLWPYHAVHHASEHLEWTSGARFHPINIIFHSVLADVVLLLLGVPPTVLAVLGPFNVAMSALVHANLDWTWGPFRYVLASPVFHRWHHTDPARGGSMNFAPTFPVIDLVFGTFYMPKGELPDGYGVDHPMPAGFLGQMAFPFRRVEAVASDPLPER